MIKSTLGQYFPEGSRLAYFDGYSDTKFSKFPFSSKAAVRYHKWHSFLIKNRNIGSVLLLVDRHHRWDKSRYLRTPFFCRSYGWYISHLHGKPAVTSRYHLFNWYYFFKFFRLLIPKHYFLPIVLLSQYSC